MRISRKLELPIRIVCTVWFLMSILLSPLFVDNGQAFVNIPDPEAVTPTDNQIKEPGLCILGESWSDNFDNYATGSSLHGQGGWKGWGNDPAGTAYTTDAYAYSIPNAVNILTTSDLVHEYADISSGEWVYTVWQYIPTNFTGQSYFIMLNQYNDAMTGLNWSVQVLFNSTTNQVLNDGGVSGGSLPLIRGQWVELRLEIDLTNDIGAFYYGNQLLYQGTWSGQVTGGGITSIAAVDLFANGASPIYYDDFSLMPEPMLVYLPLILK